MTNSKGDSQITDWKKHLPVRLLKWLEKTLPYLQAKHNLDEQDQLIISLGVRSSLSQEEIKKLTALLKAKTADEKAKTAKVEAQHVLNKERAAVHKARVNEMCKLAEMLQLAGLADPKTGKSSLDADELMGALLEIGKEPTNSDRRRQWRDAGVKVRCPDTTAEQKQPETEPVAEKEMETLPDINFEFD